MQQVASKTLQRNIKRKDSSGDIYQLISLC